MADLSVFCAYAKDAGGVFCVARSAHSCGCWGEKMRDSSSGFTPGASARPVIGVTCGHTTEGNGRFYVNEPYVRCIEAVGGLPFLIPAIDDEEGIGRLLEFVDGILLPGGVDVDPVHFGEEPIPGLGGVDPAWDRVELFVARLALERNLPILGICRGIQVLNVAAGGSLYQDIPSQVKGHVLKHVQDAPRWYPTHGVQPEPGSWVEQALGQAGARVNSFHHQAIKIPAPGFSITAKSQDGIIEAIEDQSRGFVCGVQWHPELMVEYYPEHLEFFRQLVKVAAENAKRRCRAGGNGPTAGNASN